MDIVEHDLPALFAQLGLQNSDQAITEFISKHKLAPNEFIEKADFWTRSQAEFIRQSWHEDADWVVVIDELNVRLRQNQQNQNH